MGLRRSWTQRGAGAARALRGRAPFPGAAARTRRPGRWAKTPWRRVGCTGVVGGSAWSQEGREKGLRGAGMRVPRNKAPLPELTPCVPRHLRARPCSWLRTALSSAHLPSGCQAHAPASSSLLGPATFPSARPQERGTKVHPSSSGAHRAGGSSSAKDQGSCGWSVAPPAAVSHSLGIPPWRVFPIEGNLVFRKSE